MSGYTITQYHVDSWLSGDVMIPRPLLARLMAAIETPDDLDHYETRELLEDASAVYGVMPVATEARS